ncbi:hypothetical protein V6Z11_1Z130100 [Gossypium hirsutum]
MGHRHLFGTSQMFESEPEQGRNHLHVEQPYANIARSSSAEQVSFFYPVENMPVDAVHFSSHWNSMPRSSGFATSSHNVEAPRYQPDTSGPSHDLFLHSSAPRTFGSAPENYMHHASSSNYDRQTFQGIDGGLVDLPMSSGRGPHKRKAREFPSVCERGGSSRSAEKPNVDPQHMYWDHISMPPSCRGNGLSIRGECSMRNVRSRPALDLESNLVRTHLSSNTSYLTSHPVEHSSSVNITGQSSNAMSRDWSHLRMSPSHGRIPAAGYLNIFVFKCFNHETNRFLGGSSATNASVEVGGLQHNFISGRNPVLPQGFHGNSAQSLRGPRTNYFQRSSPNFRASSSSVHIGHAASYEEGMQVVSESYSMRYPRPLSAVTWRNNERSGRSRISNDRYQSLADDAAFHGRFSSEELLALGERIGSCLAETIYSSSDQFQDESSCEEYKDMDEVGALKTCGHKYHVPCIKKWLSMKNTCPICKASAVADDIK